MTATATTVVSSLDAAVAAAHHAAVELEATTELMHAVALSDRAAFLTGVEAVPYARAQQIRTRHAAAQRADFLAQQELAHQQLFIVR